jgi:hypothetical protein
MQLSQAHAEQSKQADMLLAGKSHTTLLATTQATQATTAAAANASPYAARQSLLEDGELSTAPHIAMHFCCVLMHYKNLVAQNPSGTHTPITLSRAQAEHT